MVKGLGPRRLAALTGYFGSPENVWQAGERQLASVPGIPRKVIELLLEKRNLLNPEEEMRKLEKNGITVVAENERGYPSKLRHIYDPPPILYVRGNVGVLSMPMVAVVGARKASYYGLKVAENISRDLSQAGLCIVSGLARGIDTAAHRGALGISNPTVAVLGCGLDVVYPRENKKVLDEIIEKGAVISEFPPGTPPVAGNFPQRNRLISGVSEGVLVIEAAENSGSLITTDFALEQGRDVFAVPGQVTNRLNRGAHRLIKQGARLVEGADDILEELGWCTAKGYSVISGGPHDTNRITELTAGEKRVYNIISDDPVSEEVIIVRSGIETPEVMSMLVLMEIKGLIRQLPGRRYVRC